MQLCQTNFSVLQQYIPSLKNNHQRPWVPSCQLHMKWTGQREQPSWCPTEWGYWGKELHNFTRHSSGLGCLVDCYPPPHPSNCNCHFKSEVKQTCSSVLLQLDSESWQSPLPNWERLLDRDIIIAYMDKLKHFKIKADGHTSKLDALDAGLTFNEA